MQGRKALVLFLCVMMTAAVFSTDSAAAANYDSYSSAGYDWYIVRKENHEKASGNIPQGMDFKKYGAYYMDTETDENVMYLTFDCGYENGYTGKMLDILKKHEAKALFFVTGQYLKSQPELVKRMKKEGHFVGNHTLNHPDLTEISTEKVISEIKGCADLMKELTGYEMDPYFRAPMGRFSKKSLMIAKDLGYNSMFWSMAYLDYDVNNQPGKDWVVNHFEENYHKGAMPLIHTVSSSNCEALDKVLANLKKHKYRIGTVDEFTQKDGKLEISCKDKVYDGKPVKIKIEENTNTTGTITYIIKNSKKERVENAVKPGDYTAVAKVTATRTRRPAKSRWIRFKIKKP